MHEVLQQLISSLSVGSVYALVALGVALLSNILGLVNFAHGDLMVLGAYAMSLFTMSDSFVIAVAVGIASTAVAAVLLERVAFRPVRGASPTVLLLTSFAVSVILQNVFLVVFGGSPRPIPYPGWSGESVELAGLSIGYLDIVTLLTTALLLVLLRIFLYKTVLGLAMRATAEDFQATRAVGIPANAIVPVAFVISGALAGIAAVFWFSNSALVGANMGLSPVLKGFIAAILGGLGSLSGPVLGAFLLAFAEGFFQLVLPGSVLPYSEALVYSAVVVVLFLRPQGLLVRSVEQKA